MMNLNSNYKETSPLGQQFNEFLKSTQGVDQYNQIYTQMSGQYDLSQNNRKSQVQRERGKQGENYNLEADRGKQQMIKKMANKGREASEPPPQIQQSLHTQGIQGHQILSGDHRRVQDILQESENEESYQSSFLEVQEVQNIAQITGENDERLELRKQRQNSLNRSHKQQGYYAKMIPSFTNEKRRHLFFNHPKRGFGYVNQEIEEELWRFQKEIEEKFAGSLVNKNFKFPFLQNRERQEMSLHNQQPQEQQQLEEIQNQNGINIKLLNELTDDQKQNYIRSLLYPQRPESYLVQVNQSQEKMQRQSSEQHLAKSKSKKESQVTNQKIIQSRAIQLFNPKEAMQSPIKSTQVQSSLDNRTPPSVYQITSSNKQQMNQTGSSRNQKIQKVGNYSSQSYKGVKTTTNKTLSQHHITKITDFNSITMDKQRSVQYQQDSQSQSQINDQNSQSIKSQKTSALNQYNQSRNRQLNHKSIHLSYKPSKSVLQPSIQSDNKQTSSQQIEQNFKKNLLASNELSKNSSIIQPSKQKSHVLMMSQQQDRKKKDSSSRQLPVFQTKSINDKKKFNDIKHHLNFDSIQVDQNIPSHRDVTQISNMNNYMTSQTEEAQMYESNVIHTEPVYGSLRHNNMSSISHQYNRNTPKSNAQKQNGFQTQNGNIQINSFYQSFNNAKSNQSHNQQAIIIKSRNANLKLIQGSNDSLGGKLMASQRNQSSQERSKNSKANTNYIQSNKKKVTNKSSYHQKLRRESSNDSMNITEIRTNQQSRLDNCKIRSMSNNQREVVSSSQNVDKNIVRNSSPTKTNLDNLNKSTEKNNHQRSLTMTSQFYPINQNHLAQSPIMFQKQQSYPQQVTDRINSRNIVHSTTKAVNSMPINNLKNQSYTLFKNENNNVSTKIVYTHNDVPQYQEYQDTQMFSESLNYQNQHKQKETKCSIIEEIVGLSNASSMVETQQRQISNFNQQNYQIVPIIHLQQQQNQPRHHRNHGNSDQTIFINHMKNNSSAQDSKSSGRLSPAIWSSKIPVIPQKIIKSPINKTLVKNKNTPNSTNKLKGISNLSQTHSQLRAFIDKSQSTTKTSTIYLVKPQHKQNQRSMQNVKAIMNQSGQLHRRNYTKNEISIEAGGSCETLLSTRIVAPSKNQSISHKIDNPSSRHSHIRAL
ncbi:UNKNOWN [Stylonychia lemnae]|uniref:Uncharacterized protein n=1 Tax=Stylonychia lemnae TaxID=5949 RepID=A0A078A4N8_STYLE|nr:UNKNOWN [Stylonychia lemnae]|eukprot:CDW77235.1 UNKNOWN [Stylonychia lemnae]